MLVIVDLCNAFENTINPTVDKISLEVSNTVLTAAMATYSNSTITSYARNKYRISFLDLPYEIRLRIYHLIYLSSPVRYPQLAPWYSLKTCRTYTVQPIPVEGENGEDDECEPPSTSHKPTTKQLLPGGLLSPDRPFCRIPTVLFRSCRQIHAEAGLIAFHENEFVFLNWFSLGLSSALAFVQGREPWQRAEMRFMRMEVFAQHLTSGSTKFADWIQLCEYLPGLRGFRLLVYMDGGAAYETLGCAEVSERRIEDVQELVCEQVEWIVKGLARLRGLTQLEVELADVKWPASKKLEWCVSLREVLKVSHEGQQGVDVVCVEKLVCK